MNPSYTPTEEQFCKNCRYLQGDRCRRYAPRPGLSITGIWPAVLVSDWCGEWVAK